MAKPITPPEVLREKIMEATIDEFNEKGLKFTMDDIGARLSMSKKTLYRVFKDKDELFLGMVDYYFEAIKESEKEILDNPNMDTVEKIRKIMIVLPGRYKGIDFKQLLSLKEKYPSTYEKVSERLENDWDETINLLNQGIREGVIKDISIPVLKGIIEGSMEHFLTGNMLVEENMTYPEALEKMMDIIMDGITK